MTNPQFPFPPIWIGGDLQEYRSAAGTYDRYEAESLPPLPQEPFRGDFAWLFEQPSPLEYDDRHKAGWTTYGGLEKWPAGAARCKALLTADAAMRGVRIPEPFFAFMDDVQLVSRLRSPTDCCFVYPDALIESPAPSGGHFVHFYSDSQDCYLWYLYIDRQGRSAVVASDDLTEPQDETFWENEREQIVLCATSFESFLYRTWIENEIWYRLVKHDQPLTAEMHDYLRHYGGEA